MGEGQARQAERAGRPAVRLRAPAPRGREIAAAFRIVAIAAILAGLSASARAEPCDPWQGEPTPLPRVGESDELRSRWAALRVRELSAAALGQEANAPGNAHRLWRRVLCLDPENAAALEGLQRTPIVAVHRPPLVNRAAPGEPDDPIDALSHPLRLWRPVRQEPQQVASATTPAFEALLGEAQDHLRAARFEETLERVAVGRALEGRSDPDDTAKLEIVGATAALALGRDAEAKAGLSRALDANPDLTLDPAKTPPKVRRALERVRTERGSP